MFGSDDSIRRRARAIGLAVAGVVACLPGRSCCAETAVGGAAAGEAAGPMRPAAVYVRDIHDGPGLAGVPRGTVKSLRLVTHGLGRPPVDNPLAVSIHGAGRIVRVLGTVPVEADGSAYFAVPAGRPISLQPLDGQGRAVQRMRGSFVAASGQAVSCLGCHERPKAVPAGEAKALARKRPPSAISPWRGPERGFSFVCEVQPVLDRRCLGCHDGEAIAGGQSIPSLKSVAGTKVSATGGRRGGPFPQSYLALHRLN